MAQSTNFPISGTPLFNEDGTLTKQGSTLLRALWLASAGAPQQTGWALSTTAVQQGPLAPYTGGTTPANMAAQLVLLTDLVGTLVNALESYGVLKN